MRQTTEESRPGPASGGGFARATSPARRPGWPGNVQANLVILPKALAHDFLRFAQANPKPCPVLAVSEPGDPRLPSLGEDLDIRTDLPRYRVWRRGELIEEPPDVRHVWRDDLVSFALGCSFSFEQALVEDGIELRHMTCGSNVPMYRTNIRCAAGRPVRRSARRLDAAVEAGRRDPRDPDHLALSLGAWRAGAYRLAGGDRHRRSGQAGLRRRGAGRKRRIAGVLGLRRHSAGGHRPGQAGVLHHPRARLDADHRPASTRSWPAL